MTTTQEHISDVQRLGAIEARFCSFPNRDRDDIAWLAGELRAAWDAPPTVAELDHQGPIEGRCFMGLNFSQEDLDSISATIVEAMAGKSTMYGVEEAISELIRERNALAKLHGQQFAEGKLGAPLRTTPPGEALVVESVT